MPKFACEACETRVKVPDQYIGKRVKCPGCAKPLVVPGEQPQAKDGELDLDALDSGGAAAAPGPRRLRNLALRCGACSKIIKIPENRMGAAFTCPKCRTRLMVGRYDLPPTSGSTIDLKHIELEPLDEASLMDGSLAGGSVAGTSFGSSVADVGSIAGLTGAGTAAGASAAGATRGGSLAGGSAQDQMAQVRKLNDLKANGQISEDEYRKRKAAVFATANPVVTTRSRRRKARVPGFVKALVVLALLGAGGWFAWDLALRDQYENLMAGGDDEAPEQTLEPVVTEAPEVEEAVEVVEAAPAGPRVTLIDPDTLEPLEDITLAAYDARFTPAQPALAEATRDAGSDDAGDDAADGADAGILAQAGRSTAGLLASAQEAGSDALAATGLTGGTDDDAVSDGAPEAPPAGPLKGELAFWDVTLADAPRSWHTGRSGLHKMLTRGTRSAVLAANIGPAARTLDAMAFRTFDNAMQTRAFEQLGSSPRFRIRVLDEARELNGTTYKHRAIQLDERDRIVHLFTGIQDGFAIAYWLDGNPALLRVFQSDMLGKAVIR